MAKKKRPEPPKPKPASAPTGYRPFESLKAMQKQLAEQESPSAKPQPATRVHVPVRGASPKPLPEGLRVDDDELALHRMMSGVTPLDGRPTRLPKSQALEAPTRAHHVTSAARQAEEDAVHAHLRALVEGDRFEVSDDGERVEGRRTDLPYEVLRKLRHGAIPIDARIDLHGSTAYQARETLEQFLADKRVRGERCVLVIHGKGRHSPAGQGVLRGEIAAWLSQGSASTHVAAFSTATDEDGGEGAVYVLLAR